MRQPRNEQGDIKVSVFLPENVHQRLKIKSVQKRSSMQSILSDLAASAVEEVPTEQSVEEPAAGEGPIVMGSEQIDGYADRLKSVLASGHRLAVMSCTTAIEMSEMMLKHSAKADDDKWAYDH